MDSYERKPVVTGYPAAAQPAGTAFSYPAPPYFAVPPMQAQPHPAPPHYDPASYNGGDGNSRFLRLLIIICIAAFVVVGAVSFIVWLVLRPHLPEFAVTTASVASFNLSASQQLSSDFNITLAVRNPNKKMGIYYGKIEAAVMYESEPITETSLPPFYQGKGESTVLPAGFAAVAYYVDSDVAKGIARDRANGGVVNFHVRLLGWVRFTTGGWRTRMHIMRVYCGDVRVKLSNATSADGSLVGPSRQCQVYL